MSLAEVQDTPKVTPQERTFVISPSVWRPRVQPEVIRRLEVDEKPLDTRVHARVYPHVKRIIDIAGAVGLLMLLSPVLIVVALRLLMRHPTRVLQRTPKMGRHCRRFNEYAFTTNKRLVRKLPVLFNILKGDLSFIGPRAAYPGEMCVDCRRDPRARKRNAIRPGLICDWWVRHHANLDYVPEIPLDIRYVEASTFRKDLSIALRALPGLITLLLWGDDLADHAPNVSILNVQIDNLSMQSAIDRLVNMLDGRRASHVCFINPHNINMTFRVPEYKKVLEDADLVLADGFGTTIAGKILHRPIRQNLCGTDLFPRLCAKLSGTRKSIYLLGSAPGAAGLVAEWVRQHYPGVIIKGWGHGYFTPEEEPDVVRRVAQSGADLLIVGMGVPKQELWIQRNLNRLNVKAAIGFGGLFDYFAGRVPRAPQWVRDVGMEWLYRLIQEPRRMWRRYLIGNGLFLARVFHERLRPRAWAASPGKTDSGANRAMRRPAETCLPISLDKLQ